MVFQAPMLLCHSKGTSWITVLPSTTQLRLVGRHSVVFACWVWARRYHTVAFILHECVVDHPSACLLWHYLGITHLVISYFLCPSRPFGHPCTRRRRFTLAVHRSRLQTRLCSSPSDLFTFDIAACGYMSVSALPVEVDYRLAARGVHSWQQLLSPGVLRRRLRELMIRDVCWDVHMCLEMHIGMPVL